MKRIHFNRIDKNPIQIILLIVLIIAMVISIFKPFHLENPKIYKYVYITGMFLMIVVNGQLFWFKNAVQWNKKGIVIKLNAFFKSTSISFNHISGVELTDNTLKISRHNKKDSTFDLKAIEPSDSKKLFDIINTNRIAENKAYY